MLNQTLNHLKILNSNVKPSEDLKPDVKPSTDTKQETTKQETIKQELPATGSEQSAMAAFGLGLLALGMSVIQKRKED